MISLSVRFLDQKVFSNGSTMFLPDALDLGNYSVCDLVISVDQAATGEAPLLLLQHAPSNEDGAYLDFSTSIAVDLTVSGKVWHHLDAYTRFLGWSISGTLDSSAVVTVDVVARG